MSEKKKKHWGDRRDGRWVKEAPGLQKCMVHLYPNRTENECYLHDNIDCTELLKYIAKKNEEHSNYKTTIFHCFVTALTKMCMERPKMNYFIQGHRTYERNEISLSFVCMRRFKDDAKEALLTLRPSPEETLDEISHKIYGDITETRKSEHATGGVDAELEWFGKVPRVLLMLFIRIVRWLDFWGKCPYALIKDDPSFSSIMISNLGSIGTPAVYHHLNNYGTTSLLVVIGKIHKEQVVMDDGSIEIRDMVDVGATLDERIADGFYFARSLKLVKYMFANPELFDLPLSEPSGFDYK